MSPSKLPSGSIPQQSDLPALSREFVKEAENLKTLGFEKGAMLKILAHSCPVLEFIQLVDSIRSIGIDEYVFENLISSVWE